MFSSCSCHYQDISNVSLRHLVPQFSFDAVIVSKSSLIFKWKEQDVAFKWKKEKVQKLLLEDVLPRRVLHRIVFHADGMICLLGAQEGTSSIEAKTEISPSSPQQEELELERKNESFYESFS